MKAILVRSFGGPEVMKVEDVPDPKPGPGQVVVRLHAAGVNPVDTYVLKGTYALKPDLPYTPGSDAAGVIESLGEGVVDLRVGERVWISEVVGGRLQGAYAEKALCDAKHVHPLPDAMSFEQGAGVNTPYITAYRALFDRAAIQAGEIVLIHGASGGVGTAAVQLAVGHGAIVFGTGGSEEGRQHVLNQGAAKVFNHKDKAYFDQIKEATGGKGVDVVIEMLANVNLDHDLDLVGKGGRIVCVGSRGRVEIDPRKTFMKETVVTGVSYWSGGEPAILKAVAAVTAGLKDGALKPVVGKTFPLAEAPKSHEEVIHGDSLGKIVLTM